MTQRILAALMFGASAAFAALQATGVPKTAQEWGGIVMTFLVAAYGKFSSSQTLLAPNRPVWTPAQRAAEQALEIAKAQEKDAKEAAKEAKG